MVVHTYNLNTQKEKEDQKFKTILSHKTSLRPSGLYKTNGGGVGLISLHGPFLCSNIAVIPNY